MAGEAAFLEYMLLTQEASDFGATLTYNAATYPCSIGDAGVNARFVQGGFSPNVEIMVVIRKSVLPAGTVLKVGTLLAIQDAFGTVRNMKIAADGVRDLVFAWQLNCSDVNQNA